MVAPSCLQFFTDSGKTPICAMKKLIRIVSVFLLVFVILVFCAFLYINSGMFIKQCVLPLMAKAIDTPLTAKEANFSLFKGIEFIDLRIGAEGKPFFSASTLRIRYTFLRMFTGKLLINELSLENPVIHLIEDENGRLNVPYPQQIVRDGLTMVGAASLSREFIFQNVQIKNLSVLYERISKDPAKKISVAFADWNSSLDTLTLGQPFNVNTKAKLSISTGENIQVKSDLFMLRLTGVFGEDMRLRDMNLSLQLDQLNGNIGLFSLVDRTLDYNLSIEREDNGQYRIKHCNLSERLDKMTEASLLLTGTFSTEPKAVNGELVVTAEQSSLLALICEILGGYDIGEGSLNYHAKVLLDERTGLVSIDGNLDLTHFTFGKPDLKASKNHPMTINFRHKLSFDRDKNRLQIDTLNLAVRDRLKELLTLNLDQPTSISLMRESQITSSPATLTLTANEFDLDLISPFLSHFFNTGFKEGILETTPNMKIVHTGRLTILDGGIRLSNVNFETGGRKYQNIQSEIENQIIFDKNTADIKIKKFNILTKIDGDPAVDAKVNGSMHLDGSDGALEVNELKIHAPLTTLILDHYFKSHKINRIDCLGNLQTEFDMNEFFEVIGTVNCEDLHLLTSENLALPSFSPKLEVDITYNFNKAVEIGRNVLRIDSPFGQVASLTLLTGELDYGQSWGRIETFVNLAPLSHFIPGVSASSLMGGTVLGSFNLGYIDSQEKWSCAGRMELCDFDVVSKNSALALPVNADLEVELDYEKGGNLSINPTRFWAEDNEGETLAYVEAMGTLNKNISEKPSKMQFTSLASLDLNHLVGCLSALKSLRQRNDESSPKGMQKKAPTPRTIQNTLNIQKNKTIVKSIEKNTEKDSTMMEAREMDSWPLNLIAELIIPELWHENNCIQNVRTTAIVNDGMVILHPTQGIFNEGHFEVEGLCDFFQGSTPLCEWRASLQDADVQSLMPIIYGSNFNKMSGCIKSINLNFAEMPFGTDCIREEMKAAAYFELEKNHFTKVPEKIDPILRLLSLENDHLNFDSILASLAFDQGRLDITPFDARSPFARFLCSGNIEWNGDYYPNITFIIGYSEELAKVAKDKNIKVNKANDGYYYTNPLSIAWRPGGNGEFWNSWGPGLITELFALDPKTMAVLLGIKKVGKNWPEKLTGEDLKNTLWNLLNFTNGAATNVKPRPTDPSPKSD